MLATHKVILVFDKSNKQLWRSPLTFNVKGGLGTLSEEQAPLGAVLASNAKLPLHFR